MLFRSQGVFAREELEARFEVLVERYLKQLDIEARTLAYLVRTHVAPALEQQIARTGGAVRAARDAGLTSASTAEKLGRLVKHADALASALGTLQARGARVGALHGEQALAAASAELVPALVELRASADAIEAEIADDLWTLPRYRELLFLGV